MVKWLAGLAGSAVLAYLGVAALMFALQDRFIFPAPPGGVAVPPPGFELVWLTAAGGRVPAFWHPPQTGETTVVRFHGNGDSIGFQRFAGERLAREGFGVLLAEYQGYPGAEGSPSQAALYADGEAAYDFVRARTDGPIALYAHSLGAAVAIHVAANREVSRMVLEAPFDSMLEEVRARVPWLPVGLLLRHPFRSDLLAERIDVPTLVLHGRYDGVINRRHGERLAKRLRATYLALNAGHNDLWDHGALDRAVAFLAGS